LVTDFLPIPPKWQSSIKTGIDIFQGFQVVKDLPNATYEIIIGFTAVLVFLAAKKL
jgi:hypothetical protein